jgi:hypothetical protein
MSDATAVDRLLRAVETAIVVDDLFADDAVLDATVPHWRFRLTTGADIHRQLAGWFHTPSALSELRRLPTPSGEVVEYLHEWQDHGVPYAAHHVHVLTIDATTDRIVRDHFWCGGRWDAALLAEMGAMAHAG